MNVLDYLFYYSWLLGQLSSYGFLYVIPDITLYAEHLDFFIKRSTKSSVGSYLKRRFSSVSITNVSLLCVSNLKVVTTHYTNT